MLHDTRYVVIAMEEPEARFLNMVLGELRESILSGEPFVAPDADPEVSEELAFALHSAQTHLDGALGAWEQGE